MEISPQQTLVVVEAMRGGNATDENEGDICIDDFKVDNFECCEFSSPNPNQ